jgi:hypothetical protein
MEFFLLLRFILKPSHNHKMKQSKISSDDIIFLGKQLSESHWEAIKRYGGNTNKPSPQDAERRGILNIPEGGKSISKIEDIENPWGLSLEDLEIFNVLPPEERSSAISNTKKRASKSLQQVYTALKHCYQWCLDEYPEKRLADAYMEEETYPLHLRRTLDQSYYHMLENTKFRDRNQVVSKYIKDKMEKDQTAMIMVDQLVGIFYFILIQQVLTSE